MEVKSKENHFLFWGSLIILYSVFIFYLSLIITFQSKIEYKIPGYILSIILQLCICPFFMKFSIEESIDKYNTNRKGTSLFANIMFFSSSLLFIFNNIYLKEIVFQIFDLIILLIMIFILNKTIKIEKGDDLSLLKSINFIFVSIFISITYFLEKFANSNNDIYNFLKYFINIYYISPLLMLQGLYEALDGRSKTLPKKESYE